MIETIPIPRERARDGNDFQVRVDSLTAWPNQELIAAFEYNPRMDRWIWELNHGTVGKLIPRSKAMLGLDYSVWPYMLARFEAEDDADAVTKATLGREVVLGVYPGPLGGDFHPDADISEEEADRILRRHWFDPTRGVTGRV